jgi:hypothetical protein
MALCCAIHLSSPASAETDAQAIRSLIGAMWDKADAKVVADPVVVSGTYAVASWTQGEHGGRALLRRDASGWGVVLCGGDALRDAASLAEAGVPKRDAEQIAVELSRTEELMPPERKSKFSLFQGIERMAPAATASPHDVK